MTTWNPLSKIIKKKRGEVASKTDTDNAMEQTKVGCGDSLDISVVSQFHSQLKDVLHDAKSIELAAGDLQRIDGAGIQMLVAFFKEAEQMHIHVDWSETSDALVKAASLLGLTEQLNLKRDN